MSVVFFVAVFPLSEDGSEKRWQTSVTGRKYQDSSRLWGWYSNFEDAERTVLENHTDLFELFYTHTVIEAVTEGVGAIATVKQWFRAIWIENGSQLRIEHCEPPPFAHGIVNFTL